MGTYSFFYLNFAEHTNKTFLKTLKNIKMGSKTEVKKNNLVESLPERGAQGRLETCR